MTQEAETDDTDDENVLENELRIGHPEDDEFPVETITVEEFLERGGVRLYEQESVKTLCSSLGVPPGHMYEGGDFVWIDLLGVRNDVDIDVPSEVPLNEEEVKTLLGGADLEDPDNNGTVGFSLSRRRNLYYHRCETGNVQTEEFQFEQPA